MKRLLVSFTLMLIPFLAGCWSSILSDHPLLSDAELRRLDAIPVVRIDELTLPSPTAETQVIEIDMDGLLRPVEDRSPQSLTLTQVRDAVLQHNLELKVSMWNVPIAAAAVESEMGKFDAVVSASITDSQLVESAGNLNKPDEQYSDDSVLFNGALDIPLLTGGSLSLNSDVSSTITKLGGSQPSPKTFYATPTISISQPLLRGAWTQVTTAPVILDMYSDRLARAEQHLTVISVLSKAESQYWELAGAWEVLRQQQNIFELAELQAADAEALYVAGQAPKTEVLRAELGVSQQLSALVEADAKARSAQRSLKLSLNLPDVSLDDNDLLIPDSLPEVRPFLLDDDRLIELAMANRMELLESELELASDALKIDVARAGTLPELSVDLEAYRLGITETYWTDAIGAAFSNEGPWGWSMGLSGEFAIGNHTAEGQLRSAILTRLQTIATKHERELTIVGDVLSAVQSLQLGWKKYVSAVQSTGLAQQTYEAERRLFQMGERTSMNVAQSLQELSDARNRLIAEAVSYQLAQASLANATGCYLGRNAVELGVPRPVVDAAKDIFGPGKATP